MNKYKKLFVNYQICSYLTSQGGYSGFQVTGMTEGFFEFEICDFRIFLGVGKFWQVFFFGSLI